VTMPVDPLGPVVITSRDIYDRVVEMSGKVDRLVDRDQDTERTLNDHEARLRAQERTRWPLPALATLIALAAVAVAFWTALAGHG
jgi:hypothetical protein